jgi:hypothetical protein
MFSNLLTRIQFAIDVSSARQRKNQIFLTNFGFESFHLMIKMIPSPASKIIASKPVSTYYA